MIEPNVCLCCAHEPKMKPNGTQSFYDYCEECQTLITLAIDAISDARVIGVPKYGPSSWKEISQEGHLLHAYVHIAMLEDVTRTGPIEGDEDHLAHAICRLVMTRANENNL